MLLIKLRIKVSVLLARDLPFASAVSVTTSCAGLVISLAKEGRVAVVTTQITGSEPCSGPGHGLGSHPRGRRARQGCFACRHLSNDVVLVPPTPLRSPCRANQLGQGLFKALVVTADTD